MILFLNWQHYQKEFERWFEDMVGKVGDIMASKIRETPILYGKDADKFLKDVEDNLKKDHSKAFERAKKVYDRWNTPNRILLPDCDFCKKHQKELGALLFSPPDTNGMCKKIYICIDCWKVLNSKYIQGYFGVEKKWINGF